MGQQQLLLLVMGVIIVGIAVIVGIQAFSLNQQKVNADSLILRSLRIANEAQRWLRIPSAMGGGRPDDSHADNFNGLALDLETLGYEVDGSGIYTDVNGTYDTKIATNDFIITATSHAVSGAGVNIVCVKVSGLKVTDITTDVNPSGGVCN